MPEGEKKWLVVTCSLAIVACLSRWRHIIPLNGRMEHYRE